MTANVPINRPQSWVAASWRGQSKLPLRRISRNWTGTSLACGSVRQSGNWRCSNWSSSIYSERKWYHSPNLPATRKGTSQKSVVKTLAHESQLFLVGSTTSDRHGEKTGRLTRYLGIERCTVMRCNWSQFTPMWKFNKNIVCIYIYMYVCECVCLFICCYILLLLNNGLYN